MVLIPGDNLIAFKEMLIPRLLLVCCSVGLKDKGLQFLLNGNRIFSSKSEAQKYQTNKKIIILTHSIITEQGPPVTGD